MKLIWTVHALDELEQTFSYLEQNFTERECRRLAQRLELILKLVSKKSASFPEIKKIQKHS